MKTIIIDVANTSGGAETILRQYYADSVMKTDDEWIFMTSNIELKEAKNVKNMRYPKAATSIFFRFIFDYIIAPNLVRKYKPDRVFSFQNVDIPWVNVSQTVYLHQAIPFTKVKMKFSIDKRLWFYQNIYKYRIRHMLYRADKVIVQTNWMKEGCMQLAQKINPEKIEVKSPNVSFVSFVEYEGNNYPDFFYPANGHYHKNHRIILEAALLLKRDGINNYTVMLTLNGNENENVKMLFEKAKNAKLPIRFIGTLPYSTMVEYYKKSILLFPSYVESYGLPLLEARIAKCPVIAADTPFAREILSGYPLSVLFKYDDSYTLYEYMKTVIVSHALPLNFR